MNFAVIDVETANPDYASICSIGAVRYRNGIPTDEFYTLANPQGEFWNTYIHGISAQDVEDAPLTGEALTMLREWLAEDVHRVVCHMPFDRTATRKAAEAQGVDWSSLKFHDSARAVKLAWDEYRQKGYGLGKITKVLGIEFDHHNALADAKAAAQVLMKAAERLSIGQDELFEKISMDAAAMRRRTYYQRGVENPEVNPDGEFFGQAICFTGTMNIVRSEAIALAAAAGFETKKSVGKSVTILVSGDADPSRFSAGQDKSRKLREAERKIAGGQDLRIITPEDFAAMVAVF